MKKKYLLSLASVIFLCSCQFYSCPSYTNIHLNNNTNHNIIAADVTGDFFTLLQPYSEKEIHNESDFLILYTLYNNKKLFYSFGNLGPECYLTIRNDGIIVPNQKYYKNKRKPGEFYFFDLNEEFVPVRYLGAFPKRLYHPKEASFSTVMPYFPRTFEKESFVRISYPYFSVPDNYQLQQSNKVKKYDRKQSILLNEIHKVIDGLQLKQSKKIINLEKGKKVI